jgi:hypothetical protein
MLLADSARMGGAAGFGIRVCLQDDDISEAHQEGSSAALDFGCHAIQCIRSHKTLVVSNDVRTHRL